jgi:hypothetical protein
MLHLYEIEVTFQFPVFNDKQYFYGDKNVLCYVLHYS